MWARLVAFETVSSLKHNQAKKKAMNSQNDRIWSYDSLRNFLEFSPAVQNHFDRAHLTLCFALLAGAFGTYLHMLWNIGGLFTTLGSIGTMIWIRFTPSYEHLSKRLSLLFLCAFLKGASVGPMIMLFTGFDSSILITLFVGAAIAFVWFSAAVMFARRREYLYLGASISYGLSMLSGAQMASSIFGGSTSVLGFELYFGLLIFVVYIVVDTQVIIEKVHSGDMDYVIHSLTMSLILLLSLVDFSLSTR